MAKRFCSSCGYEILHGDKVRLKIGGIFAASANASFAIEEDSKKYIPGTLKHKSCDDIEDLEERIYGKHGTNA